MKIVIFGLTITSSWGNGHATLWRALTTALVSRGCEITFFERDQPYYAAHRDFVGATGVDTLIYSRWDEIEPRARQAVREADVSIVTSYCPDGSSASSLSTRASHVRVLYDLDTPVTLEALAREQPVTHIDLGDLSVYDLVASFTGGPILSKLSELGARRVLPLYGFADKRAYAPACSVPRFRSDLSFLGTYAQDRRAALTELLLEPARTRLQQSFLIAGAQYPSDFAWAPNIRHIPHVAPAEHPAFFASGRLTLNVTREVMRRSGWCPSGRLFEAAACAAPIVSDRFAGLENFFEPGQEILPVDRCNDVLATMELTDGELAAIGRAARERVLAEHTADHRAEQLLAAISDSRSVRNPVVSATELSASVG